MPFTYIRVLIKLCVSFVISLYSILFDFISYFCIVKAINGWMIKLSLGSTALSILNRIQYEYCSWGSRKQHPVSIVFFSNGSKDNSRSLLLKSIYSLSLNFFSWFYKPIYFGFFPLAEHEEPPWPLAGLSVSTFNESFGTSCLLLFRFFLSFCFAMGACFNNNESYERRMKRAWYGSFVSGFLTNIKLNK